MNTGFKRLDTIPAYEVTLQKDYTSPAIEISGSVFGLAKNYQALLDNNQLLEMGGLIRPGGAAGTFIAALLSGFSAQALQTKYKNVVISLVKMADDKLRAGEGTIFNLTYNYNDLGTPDVTSIRFRANGIGKSPEQSLASGPIDQLSEDYQGASVFPNYSLQYVWIYKAVDGSLTVTTIKDPFIRPLREKALKEKVNQMKQSTALPNQIDPTLGQFYNAKVWIDQSQQFARQLADSKKLDDVNKINADLVTKQKQFNDLYAQYKQAQERRRSSQMLDFINSCTKLAKDFKLGAPDDQANDVAQYTFQKNNTPAVDDVSPDLLRGLANGLRGDEDHLKIIYDSAHLPSPDPTPIPEF